MRAPVLVLLLAMGCLRGDARDANGSASAGATAPSMAGASGGAGGVDDGESGAAAATSSGTDGSDPASPGATPTNLQALFDESCATETLESVRAQLLPSHILFVLDRSASMICNPPPITDALACETSQTRDDTMALSKWEVATAEFKKAIAPLPGDTGVGISYFSTDDVCGVRAAPAVAIRPLATPGHLTTIDTSLAAQIPVGSTPLVGATILAYRHLHDQALDGHLLGNRFVVVLTDGSQSDMCADDKRCETRRQCETLLLDKVSEAAAVGVNIRTFAIGAPGSGPASPLLSQIAVNGGTAPAGCSVADGDCHFDMTEQSDFGSALQNALDEITRRTITCELPVPTMQADALDRVNVVYTPGNDAEPILLPQDPAPCDGGSNGWQYTAGDTKIQLCGPLCDTIRNDPGARVDVVLGCPYTDPS